MKYSVYRFIPLLLFLSSLLLACTGEDSQQMHSELMKAKAMNV